jgi:hypothetical protein
MVATTTLLDVYNHVFTYTEENAGTRRSNVDVALGLAQPTAIFHFLILKWFPTPNERTVLTVSPRCSTQDLHSIHVDLLFLVSMDFGIAQSLSHLHEI